MSQFTDWLESLRDEVPLPFKEALHDLWGCIGAAEIQHLQPETIEIASAIHQELAHAPGMESHVAGE
jgi:hypothetical protein